MRAKSETETIRKISGGHINLKKRLGCGRCGRKGQNKMTSHQS